MSPPLPLFTKFCRNLLTYRNFVRVTKTDDRTIYVNVDSPLEPRFSILLYYWAEQPLISTGCFFFTGPPPKMSKCGKVNLG